jgi:DNA modification methylase
MGDIWADEATGTVLCGLDMRAVLGSVAEASADSCVCDPPYGLAEHPRKRIEQAVGAWLAGDRWFVPDGRGFMSKRWDTFVPPPAAWDEVYRVLKPGSWLLAFAAPRTQDLMGLSIRLAGFEIQDTISWWTGSGFPKAKSRLKPAHEPVIVAWKPAKHVPPLPGLDGCRVGTQIMRETQSPGGVLNCNGRDVEHGNWQQKPNDDPAEHEGRWPPDLLLTHSADCQPAGMLSVRSDGHHPAQRGPGGISTNGHGGQTGLDERKSGTETVQAWDCAPDCPVAGLDAQSGVLHSQDPRTRASRSKAIGVTKFGTGRSIEYDDKGGASRFFPQLNWGPEDLPFLYQAKAPKSERPQVDGVTPHCSVKPLAVMRWLVRLVTPLLLADGRPGLVLDPFAGTGTTLQAARLEGFRSLGCENDPDSATLARKRLGLGEFAPVPETAAG